MQYYPQFNGYPNGETNFPYAPNLSDFPAVAAPIVSPRSQIVGVGDVTSVTLPDGTLQLYFVPAPRSYLASYLPWGVVPAWFIRTVPNLFAAPPTLPLANHRENSQSSTSYLFPNNPQESEEKLKYQLQFHNDQTTSSTDVHYFSQPLHSRWFSTSAVETQADKPVKFYDACCKCCHTCHCDSCNNTRKCTRTSEKAME